VCLLRWGDYPTRYRRESIRLGSTHDNGCAGRPGIRVANGYAGRNRVYVSDAHTNRIRIHVGDAHMDGGGISVDKGQTNRFRRNVVAVRPGVNLEYDQSEGQKDQEGSLFIASPFTHIVSRPCVQSLLP